ncbi:MAG: hypothetical protein NDI61_06230 [Bdellovibrionaceae bacterium]|nr:hypothetical protein [Pseudobdellovibrionaceae bacterium]
MTLLKLSVAAVFMTLSISATANAQIAQPIVGKCHFEAPDQEQADDCHAKFILCPRIVRAPAEAPETLAPARRCISTMVVSCGGKLMFKGGLDVDANGTVMIEGRPNSTFPDAPTISFATPTSLPAEVDAELDLDDVDYEGTCRISRWMGHGHGMDVE